MGQMGHGTMEHWNRVPDPTDAKPAKQKSNKRCCIVVVGPAHVYDEQRRRQTSVLSPRHITSYNPIVLNKTCRVMSM